MTPRVVLIQQNSSRVAIAKAHSLVHGPALPVCLFVRIRAHVAAGSCARPNTDKLRMRAKICRVRVGLCERASVCHPVRQAPLRASPVSYGPSEANFSRRRPVLCRSCGALCVTTSNHGHGAKCTSVGHCSSGLYNGVNIQGSASLRHIFIHPHKLR
ncbi:hypothetical protein FKP32DRAFT_945197 [Trametes sanguinea]|nr:hypothetical protein FKP32DRAFT_945197 [Trametes sanguinea]